MIPITALSQNHIDVSINFGQNDAKADRRGQGVQKETETAAVLQKKASRTVERTKGWIFDALMQLLEKKPWAEIGISDICKKAGVARSSFYRHYETREDIINQYMDTFFCSIVEKIQESGLKSPQKPLVVYFKALKEYRGIAETLLRNDIASFVDASFAGYETRILNAYRKKLPPREYMRFQYAIKFQRGGLSRMVQSWIKNKMSPSPAEMNDIAEEFIKPFRKQKRSIIDLIFTLKER
jgi:AcrR family transcriptional regulator